MAYQTSRQLDQRSQSAYNSKWIPHGGFTINDPGRALWQPGAFISR